MLLGGKIIRISETITNWKILLIFNKLSQLRRVKCGDFFRICFHHVVLKTIYLLRHYLKFKFCCQSCDVIFPPKPLKSKNKKHTTVWSTKFNHPAKFGLKRIKTVKADSSLASLSDPKVATADLAWTNSFYNKDQIHRAFWLVQKVCFMRVKNTEQKLSHR